MDDPRIELAKQLMGARFRKLREESGVTVSTLAERSGKDRSYIHDIETGRANFSIDIFAQLLSHCGVDFEEFLTGLEPSDAPAHHQEFYRMLRIILNSGIKDLIQGIRVNLEAISEKAVRLQNARASPSRPEPRETGRTKKNKHAS